jgi:hypothetical protein
LLVVGLMVKREAVQFSHAALYVRKGSPLRPQEVRADVSCHDLTLLRLLLVVENSLVTPGKGDLISTKRVSGMTRFPEVSQIIDYVVTGRGHFGWLSSELSYIFSARA